VQFYGFGQPHSLQFNVISTIKRSGSITMVNRRDFLVQTLLGVSAVTDNSMARNLPATGITQSVTPQAVTATDSAVRDVSTAAILYLQDFVQGDAVDQTEAIQRAIDRTPNGGRLVGETGMVYRAQGLIVRNKAIEIDLNDSALELIPTDPQKNLLTFVGELEGPYPVEVGAANVGETVLQFDSLPTGVVRGSWLKVVSDDLAPQIGHSFRVRLGQALLVREIRGRAAYCHGQLFNASLYKSNVRVGIFPSNRCSIANGNLRGAEFPNVPGIPKHHLIFFDSLLEPRAANLKMERGSQPGIVFRSCVLARSSNCEAKGFGDSLGVAVASQNSFMTKVYGAAIVGARHLADANANSVPDVLEASLSQYGQDMFFESVGGVAIAATTSALTVHSPTYGAIWCDHSVVSSARVVGVRGDAPSWSRIHARGCVTGIQVVADSRNIVVEEFDFEDIEEQGLVQSGVLEGRCVIRSGRMACRLVNKKAMLVPVIAAEATLILEDLVLRYTGAQSDKIIIQAYGQGSLELNNVTFDLRAAGSLKGIRLIEIAGPLASVRGSNNRILMNEGDVLESVIAVNNASMSYVDLEIVGDPCECEDIIAPRSANKGKIFLKYSFRTRDHDVTSSWVDLDLGQLNSKFLYSSSSVDHLILNLIGAPMRNDFELAPGHHKGQKCVVVNHAEVDISLNMERIPIAKRQRRDFLWNGRQWI